jgi:hypothetical protein
MQQDFECRYREGSVECLEAEVVRGFFQVEVGGEIPAFRDNFALGVEYSLADGIQALKILLSS